MTLVKVQQGFHDAKRIEEDSGGRFRSYCFLSAISAFIQSKNSNRSYWKKVKFSIVSVGCDDENVLSRTS